MYFVRLEFEASNLASDKTNISFCSSIQPILIIHSDIIFTVLRSTGTESNCYVEFGTATGYIVCAHQRGIPEVQGQCYSRPISHV